VTPERAEGKHQASPTAGLAQAIMKNTKSVGVTETYTAYGRTEELYKECAKQANYTIPQAADTEAELPKTEDGEDLGVGGGWWHDGILLSSLHKFCTHPFTHSWQL
jgi:cytochrome b pre-mRNA-processing protein 3